MSKNTRGWMNLPEPVKTTVEEYHQMMLAALKEATGEEWTLKLNKGTHGAVAVLTDEWGTRLTITPQKPLTKKDTQYPRHPASMKLTYGTAVIHVKDDAGLLEAKGACDDNKVYDLRSWNHNDTATAGHVYQGRHYSSNLDYKLLPSEWEWFTIENLKLLGPVYTFGDQQMVNMGFKDKPRYVEKGDLIAVAVDPSEREDFRIVLPDHSTKTFQNVYARSFNMKALKPFTGKPPVKLPMLKVDTDAGWRFSSKEALKGVPIGSVLNEEDVKTMFPKWHKSVTGKGYDYNKAGEVKRGLVIWRQVRDILTHDKINPQFVLLKVTSVATCRHTGDDNIRVGNGQYTWRSSGYLCVV